MCCGVTQVLRHASQHTRHASLHTRHASQHTTHASQHTVHASQHTTHARPVLGTLVKVVKVYESPSCTCLTTHYTLYMPHCSTSQHTTHCTCKTCLASQHTTHCTCLTAHYTLSTYRHVQCVVCCEACAVCSVQWGMYNLEIHTLSQLSQAYLIHFHNMRVNTLSQKACLVFGDPPTLYIYIWVIATEALWWKHSVIWYGLVDRLVDGRQAETHDGPCSCS